MARKVAVFKIHSNSEIGIKESVVKGEALRKEILNYLKGTYGDYHPGDYDDRYNVDKYNAAIKMIHKEIKAESDPSYISAVYIPELRKKAMRDGDYNLLYAIEYLDKKYGFKDLSWILDDNSRYDSDDRPFGPSYRDTYSGHIPYL